jgi:4-azaleucine resistance transporter AzlC
VTSARPQPQPQPLPAAHRPGSFLRIGREQWHDFWVGARAVAPLDAGSFLFGMAFGALVSVSGINPWAGLSGSFTVVAGASQVAIVEALRGGAPAIIAIATAIVINARFALYSTALAPLYAAFPRRWQLWLSYLMTDQSAAVSLQRGAEYPDPVRRRWWMFGVSFTFVFVWWVGTAVGVFLGPVIPSAWEIGFIIPLMFIAVMVPGLRRRPELVAVAVSVAVTVVTKDLGYGLNILLGAVAGIAVGAFVPDATGADANVADASSGNPPGASDVGPEALP